MSSIVEQVHELEDEFGGIANIPADEPRLLEIRKLLHSTNHKQAKKPLTNDQKKEIKKLWEQNWIDRDIANELDIPIDITHNARSKFGKANRQVFTLKRGFEVHIFSSLSQVSNFLSYNSPRKWDDMQPRLKQQGWHVSERITHDY